MKYLKAFFVLVFLTTTSVIMANAQIQSNTSQRNGLSNNTLNQTNSTLGNRNQNSLSGNNLSNTQSTDNTQGRSPRRTSRRMGSQTTGTGTSGTQGVRSRPSRTTRPSSSTNSAPSSGNSGISVFQSNSGSGNTAAKASVVPRPKLRRVATMYLDSQKQTVAVNQPFTVDVKISVPEGQAFDKLAFTLRYDPDDLLPIQGIDSKKQWIPANSVQYANDTAPEDKQDADATKVSTSVKETSFLLAGLENKPTVLANGINTTTGLIQFALDMPTGSKEGVSVISRLTFVPLRESKRSRVEFVFSDSKITADKNVPLTFLHKQNQDVLGTSVNSSDGVIPLDLTIVSSIAELPNERVSERETQSRNAILKLIPREQTANTGDEIAVDVVLSNPDKKTIDSINLLVLYNPRVFEAIDGDPKKSGVNIDGRSYKRDFPFDFPILNSIDTDKGIIDYRQRAVKNLIRKEGVLATIRFKALRPTKKTTLRLLVNETGEAPTTGVFYRNKDRLGNPDDPTDGFQTTSLSVHASTAFLQSYLADRDS